MFLCGAGVNARHSCNNFSSLIHSRAGSVLLYVWGHHNRIDYSLITRLDLLDMYITYNNHVLSTITMIEWISLQYLKFVYDCGD